MQTQTVVETKSTPYPPVQGAGAEKPPANVPPPAGGAPPEAFERLKSERVQEELRAMPAWQLAHDARAIESVKTFPTPEVAALYAAYAARYGTAAGYSVTVSISGGQVCVTVFAPQVNGCAGDLTDSVLAFARQLI
jgi:pterin-4a-carbinolamine dehydratase